MEQLEKTVARLVARDSQQTEADIQSDIKLLLTTAPLNLTEENLVRHQRLVQLARELEVRIGEVELPEDLHFAAARRRLRETIEANSAGREIEQLVSQLLKS